MGISAARIGDRCFGTCKHPVHSPPIVIGGTIIQGSPDTNVNSLPHARLSDQVLTDCGHIGNIITGDNTVIVNGLPAARIGDQVGGVYIATIITGSSDVQD